MVTGWKPLPPLVTSRPHAGNAAPPPARGYSIRTKKKLCWTKMQPISNLTLKLPEKATGMSRTET
eukprot:7452362-Prorocentrum_lima.AAC.1